MKTLNYNADYVARKKWTTPNAAGTFAAAGGITTWAVRISATPTGSAIGALSGTASEYTTSGFYYYTFDKAALTTALATSYLGTIVYEIWSKSGDVDDFYVPLIVTDRTAVA